MSETSPLIPFFKEQVHVSMCNKFKLNLGHIKHYIATKSW